MTKRIATAFGLVAGFILPLTTAGAPVTLFHIEAPQGGSAAWTIEAVSLPPPVPPEPILPPPQVIKVWATAYSSAPEETDDTPFITASGTEVREGVIAANFLPFGAKVKIPALFGERVFLVEDRMHPRMGKVVDLWMPSKEAALAFGRRRATIVVVD